MGGHLPASGDVQSAGGAGGWPAEAASLSPQPQAVGGQVPTVQAMDVSLAYKVRSVISRESWLVSYGGNQSTGWTVSPGVSPSSP